MNTSFKFSPSVGCFYPSDVDYPSVPSDLIDVPPSEYAKAMSRRADQRFEVSPEGVVTLIDPTEDELAASALANFMGLVDSALKSTREKALTYFMTNTPFPAEWVAYSQALVALKSTTTVQELPTPPQG
jgi:hypothetical protein